ncbi:MAG TPA: VOC family protein [Candidatus Sulfotelmatobacter sp.]|nr:VOC family protein [Candidatus Sulfotelmatobacter sp.]
MAETRTAIANKPVWVDLASSDAAGSRDFYSKLFGWTVEVNPDPQYGGYGMAKVGDRQVAGIGPKMSPEAPTAWSLYIGTENPDELAKKVEAAGGKVLAAPFDVGDQGRMAAFQDPSGAVISAWQPKAMAGSFPVGEANTFGWAELNSRGVDKAIAFYRQVFGWSAKKNDMGPDAPPYTEFQLGGQSIAGAQEMNKMVPAQVPSHWLVYFAVTDVDRSFKKAIDAGAREMLAPMDFPGGRLAILQDPQGAAFGLLIMNQA